MAVPTIEADNRQVSAAQLNAAVQSANSHAGVMVRDLREALGWPQQTLAAKAGVSQSWVSRVERGASPSVSIAEVEKLLRAMGARLILDASAPFLAKPRQRDRVHAKCTSHIAGRLERAGWRIATEVEVGGDRSRGWIDVLAWHPTTGLLLVIEVKTELHDLGSIERQLNWYEREAWVAARRLGWRPRRVSGCLLLLATEAAEQRLRDNREPLARLFPMRSRDLTRVVVDGWIDTSAPTRGLALIDPRSRRAAWLRPSRLDGRRTSAPYADYADFVRQDVRARRAS